VVGLLRVAIVPVGGWLLLQQTTLRSTGCTHLIAGSTALGALMLATAFILRPPSGPGSRFKG
jgi:hypothetical protein